MRLLELRRHAETRQTKEPSGPELSDRGMRRARQVGERAGLFSYVVTSAGPGRGVETAAAMGYMVDRRVDMGGGELLTAMYKEIGGFHVWRDWSNPFVTFATFIDMHGAAAYDAIPEIEQAWSLVRDTANALFVLALIAAGVLVMASGTLDSRYSAKALVPRVALAAIAANASLALCGGLIQLRRAHLRFSLCEIPTRLRRWTRCCAVALVTRERCALSDRARG